MFGSSQHSQSQPSSLFGNPPSQSQPGLFGSVQPQQSSGLFGATTQSSGGLLGGLGGNTISQGPGLFGQTQQPQQQQGFGLLADTRQRDQQSQFGQSQQQQQTPLQLGQSQQAGPLGQSQNAPPLWEEGRGLGVYRTIPAQVGIVKDKWNPHSLSSPLRTYLYQVVNESEAPFYQPSRNVGYEEDEIKWEEAFANRPGPSYVPALARGFWDLGKRAQRQREFIEKCNIRLHDINSSLDAQLEIHSQQIATRMAECRRKHVIASQRTLALAAKIQVLRNRGYVMGNAEEHLRKKLVALEREVFDPSLNGREQEIWARMVGIRERGRILKAEMERAGPVVREDEATLDEETVQTAKKALEAYDTQLRHLQKELQLVQQEYADWENGSTRNQGNLDGTNASR